tara:strand:- start:5303 stop:6235 length:933 start_codon:yes stop_codon:yes gene_type:complete
MTDMPGPDSILFTVVIPLHNKGPHVRRAVDSVLAQTHPAFEIVVIDDVSSDDGPDQVLAIKDERIRMIARDTPGPGGYAARNAGIAAARGNWIAFLDADDRWDADHLAQIARLAGPEIGCVFTAHRIEPVGTKFPTNVQTARLIGRDLGADDIIAAWLGSRRCPLWTGAVAVRRDVLERVGPFREKGITRGGDKDMWLRIVAATQSRFGPRPTACFYQDTVNRVSNSAAHTRLPAITGTIDRLVALGSLDPELLRGLKSQEVGLYIRYSLGKRQPVPLGFLRSLRWSAPSDWRHIAMVAASLPFHLCAKR